MVLLRGFFSTLLAWAAGVALQASRKGLALHITRCIVVTHDGIFPQQGRESARSASTIDKWKQRKSCFRRVSLPTPSTAKDGSSKSLQVDLRCRHAANIVQGDIQADLRLTVSRVQADSTSSKTNFKTRRNFLKRIAHQHLAEIRKEKPDSRTQKNMVSETHMFGQFARCHQPKSQCQ